MAVTLANIAELAKTHPSTVSLVLNGRQVHRVSPATRERIERIAKELGYSANRHAQGLARGATKTVALLLNDLSNPFFGRYVSLLEKHFEGHGYHVMPLDTQWKNAREVELMSHLRQGLCDLVLSLVHYQRDDDESLAHEPIVVRLDGWEEQPLASPLSTVVVRYLPSLIKLIQHFEQSGRRTLGLILHENNEPFSASVTESRYAAAFRAVLGQSSLQSGRRFQASVHENEPLDAWHQAAIDLLQRQPTIDSLIVHTSSYVAPVLEAARRLGRVVGKDLAVATFDDPPFAAWAEGGVTVIREPMEQVAAALAERSLALLAGEPHPPNLSVDAELVVRASTDPSTARPLILGV